MTIAQMMEWRRPGTLKVRLKQWAPEKFVVVYFYDAYLKSWYGLENGHGVCIGEGEDWLNWEETP